MLRSIIACSLLSAAFGADKEATTAAVTVKFQGASGGMSLYPSSDSKSFIKVAQEKLEEVDAKGKVVKQINVAGQNSWADLVTEERDGKTLYSTTFHVEESGVTFELTAHLARDTATTSEVVACTGCTGDTTGTCQDAATKDCTAPTAPDAAYAEVSYPPAEAAGTCQAESALCTEDVTVTKDTLEFSLMVSGWEFADPANKLHYGLAISSKAAGKKEGETLEKDGNKKKVSLDGGYVTMPTTGRVLGGATEKTVDVVVTTGMQGSKSMIYFEFPSFESTEMLYFDPTLGVESSAAAAAPTMLLVGLLATFAALL